MEVEDRYLVFDGDLVELNQDDYTAKQRIHAYLLSDSLMIASWLSDKCVRSELEQIMSCLKC